MRIDIEPEKRSELGKSLGWAIALGVLMVVLGVLAIAHPLFATLTATLVFGWLFILGGIVRFIFAFQTRGVGQFFLKLLVGILYLGAGILLVNNPVGGALTLTLILGIAIFVQGVLQTILAFQLSSRTGRGWVLLSGISSIILGILIWQQWQTDNPWVLGLLVGVNLLFDGLWIVMLSSTAHSELRSAKRL